MKFDVVVNHFSNRRGISILEASALLSASLYADSPYVSSVIVVDGSAEANESLRDVLLKAGVQYQHAGERLSFAAGYNAGLKGVKEDWVILSASDVYASQTLMENLNRAVESGRFSDAGCLIPRLTVAALPYQATTNTGRDAVAVPLMTLNLNAFPTDFLRSLGGVPEEFSGNFNDVVLAQMVHEAGRQIYLLPDVCVHYGRLTIGSSSGAKTLVSQDLDYQRWAARFRHLRLDRSFWDVDLRCFSRPKSIWRLIGQAAFWTPGRLRAPLQVRFSRLIVSIRSSRNRSGVEWI